jgi:Protein of unknown function (DUF2442)
MKSKIVGRLTLDVEITNIDMKGIWLLTNDKEFFLPFEKFPEFRDATVREIHNVRIANQSRLYWPDLDVDLPLDTIGNGNAVPRYS